MTDQDIQALLATGDEALAEAAFRTGDFGAAHELLESARAAATEAGDVAAQAGALERLGMLAHYENITKLRGGAEVTVADIEAEEKLFREALACWEPLGEPAATALSLFGLGLVFQVLHSDWMTAMPYFWQALGLVSSADTADLYLRSEVHRHVGFYFLVEDVQPGEAVRHLQISLDLREELGDERRIPSGLIALAEAELAAGSRERAVQLLQRAVAQSRSAGLTQQRIEEAERALHKAQESAAPQDGPPASPPPAEPSPANPPPPADAAPAEPPPPADTAPAEPPPAEPSPAEPSPAEPPPPADAAPGNPPPANPPPAEPPPPADAAPAEPPPPADAALGNPPPAEPSPAEPPPPADAAPGNPPPAS